MKKIFGILSLFFVLAAMLSVVVSAKDDKKDPFCIDSDNGIDIWTAGFTTTDKDVNSDDCDGASENLKEVYCDGNKSKVTNIKCSDYNAVCVSVENAPDYCGCADGLVFDENEGMCVEEDPQVPEFGVVAAAVALIGAVAVFAFKRK